MLYPKSFIFYLGGHLDWEMDFTGFHIVHCFLKFSICFNSEYLHKLCKHSISCRIFFCTNLIKYPLYANYSLFPHHYKSLFHFHFQTYLLILRWYKWLNIMYSNFHFSRAILFVWIASLLINWLKETSQQLYHHRYVHLQASRTELNMSIIANNYPTSACSSGTSQYYEMVIRREIYIP